MKREEQGLPGDLVTQLRHLAETETSGSRPFPGVDQEISRRRGGRYLRYGSVALAGAVAAAVVVVEVLVGGAFRPDDQGSPVAPTPSVSSTPGDETTPVGAGYPAQTQGSLAGDQAWLEAFRQEVLRNSGDEVFVTAAGDVEDRARFAVVLVRGSAEDTDIDDSLWSREFWIGAAGAAAPEMQPVSSGPGEGRKVPAAPMAVFTTSDFSDDPAKAVVVISAPGAEQIAITSSRTFTTSTRDDRDTVELAWSGKSAESAGTGVWASPLTKNQFFISEAQIDLESISSMTTARGLDLTQVMAAGTDPAELAWLSGSMDRRQAPTLAETPVYAGTAPAGDGGQFVAALLRAPDGEHLYALTEHRPAPEPDAESVFQVGGLLPNSTGSAEAMAGMVTSDNGVRRYSLLVPEGTAKVRVHGKTADVNGRLAVLELPGPAMKTYKADALAADGSVLASITPLSEEVSESEVPSDYNSEDDGTSIRM